MRGEPVVKGVLEATILELAAVGYGALRIEDVATRAHVNKTTIYRRWPTKQELVAAALRSVTHDWFFEPSTGSLRGDLLAVGRHMVQRMSSAEGQAVRRIFMSEERNPEFAALARGFRESLDALSAPVIDAARRRGELKPEVSGDMLVRIVAGTLQHRLYIEGEEADEGFLVPLIELLLTGALAPGRRG